MNETSSPRAALILAGGAGTRLWPLSTDECPKQFLPLFGGKSLLRHTWERLTRLVPEEAIWIATSERYRELVARDLPSLSPSSILVEPARRNTAPAIATCCAAIRGKLGDAVVGVFPSDHAVADPEAFVSAAEAAYRHAAKGTHLLTVGIEPTRPDVNYGYLELGEPLNDRIRSVQRFVEKPSAELAREYVHSGRFLWNGGMFVWRLDTFLEALSAAAPDLSSAVHQWQSTAPAERDEVYEQMPSISIDYALMERASAVATVPGNFGWSDVGTWKSLIEHARPTGERAHLLRSDGSWVLSGSQRPVVVVGVPNVVVIDTPEGVLVLDPENDSGLSDLVKRVVRSE